MCSLASDVIAAPLPLSLAVIALCFVSLRCVLALQSMFEESKYGAYVFDGTWNDPQPVDVIAYTALQNSSAYHATAVYMNVSGCWSACVAAGWFGCSYSLSACLKLSSQQLLVLFLQMMNSALYKATNPSGSISVHNYPLPYTQRQEVAESAIMSMFIALGIIMGFAFVSAFYASFLVYERENNVKHQQASTMSSKPPPGRRRFACYSKRLMIGSLIVCLLLSHMCAVDFRDQRQRLLDLQSHLGCAAVPDPHVYVTIYWRAVFPVNSCPILLFCGLLCLYMQGPQSRF
jgi:hypothetical protein